jgi:hypothetical protein
MTPREIALRRLRSQHITGPTLRDPAKVVEHLLAVQSQDYAGAVWGVGLRLRNRTAAHVESAFASGEILRTHVLRPTWHFVRPNDLRWLLQLTAPRVRQRMAPYDRRLEITPALMKRARTLVAKALDDGPRTRLELREALENGGVDVGSGQRLGHIMLAAELDEVACSGPRRGKQFTYALFDHKVPPSRPRPRDEALAELARRFFLSRGPATAQDLAWWASLTVADVTAAVADVGRQLRREDIDGRTYWMSPRDRGADDPSPTAHLISIYDEYVSSYKDRRALGRNDVAPALAGFGNALQYAVLVDGCIVGTWQRHAEVGSVGIKVRRRVRLDKAENAAIEKAARRYGDFFGLSVELS